MIFQKQRSEWRTDSSAQTREMLAGSTAARAMRKTANARRIAEVRADNTAGRSSIRRRVGDGDVNLADVWPTITRVGAEPEARRGLARAGSTARKHAGSTAWKRAGSTARASAGNTARRRAGSTAWTSAGSPAEAGPSYRTCTRSPLRRRVSRYQA